MDKRVVVYFEVLLNDTFLDNVFRVMRICVAVVFHCFIAIFLNLLRIKNKRSFIHSFVKSKPLSLNNHKTKIRNAFLQSDMMDEIIIKQLRRQSVSRKMLINAAKEEQLEMWDRIDKDNQITSLFLDFKIGRSNTFIRSPISMRWIESRTSFRVVKHPASRAIASTL